MTAPSPDAPPRPVRWDSDGACRCADLRNVWGGRTTHYRSQCHPEDYPDDQAATTAERRADR